MISSSLKTDQVLRQHRSPIATDKAQFYAIGCLKGAINLAKAKAAHAFNRSKDETNVEVLRMTMKQLEMGRTGMDSRVKLILSLLSIRKRPFWD